MISNYTYFVKDGENLINGKQLQSGVYLIIFFKIEILFGLYFLLILSVNLNQIWNLNYPYSLYIFDNGLL